VYLEIPKKKQRPHYGGSRMDNYFSSKDILDKDALRREQEKEKEDEHETS